MSSALYRQASSQPWRIIEAKGEHFFWTGDSKPKSAVGDYQRALRRLFDLAETPRVYAHLFRHTFATELLTAGNSLETVATLLGHSSTKVCLKELFALGQRAAREARGRGEKFVGTIGHKMTSNCECIVEMPIIQGIVTH